jgi:hypothetical protein
MALQCTGNKKKEQVDIIFLNLQSGSASLNKLQIMKTLILASLLAILTFSINAQGRGSTIYVDALKRDKNMERIGTGLTIIGGVSLFVGNILYWRVYHDNSGTSSGYVNTYRSVMLGGLALMAVGIPVWSYGKANERHIKVEAQLIKFKGLASANGIGLRIRF